MVGEIWGVWRRLVINFHSFWVRYHEARFALVGIGGLERAAERLFERNIGLINASQLAARIFTGETEMNEDDCAAPGPSPTAYFHGRELKWSENDVPILRGWWPGMPPHKRLAANGDGRFDPASVVRLGLSVSGGAGTLIVQELVSWR